MKKTNPIYSKWKSTGAMRRMLSLLLAVLAVFSLIGTALAEKTDETQEEMPVCVGALEEDSASFDRYEDSEEHKEVEIEYPLNDDSLLSIKKEVYDADGRIVVDPETLEQEYVYLNEIEDDEGEYSIKTEDEIQTISLSIDYMMKLGMWEHVYILTFTSGEEREFKLSIEDTTPEITEPEPSAEPDATEPEPSAEPDDTEPEPSAEPDATEPEPSAEPDATETEPSAEPDATEPEPSAEPDATETEPSAEPDATEPEPSAEPDATEPEPSAEPVIDEPEASAEPELEEVPEIGDIAAIEAYSGMLFFSQRDLRSGQSLVVEFVNATTNNQVGKDSQMRLYATLSDTTAGSYATVRIPIPNTPSGITFSQFVNNKYTVSSDGKSYEISIVTSGSQKYLEFTLKAGQTLTALIRVGVQNGVNENGVTINFGDPIVYDSQFSGTPAMHSGNVSFSASFGWNDVTNSALPSTVEVISNGDGTYTIDSDISYTLTALNKYSSANYGAIYTKEFTLTDSITLPTGMSFKTTGTPVLSSDRKTILINGTAVVTFDKAINSVSLSGNVLSYTYKVTNSTLGGSSPAEIENMTLKVTLLASGLSINTGVLYDSSSITNSASFNALPYKGSLTHNSSASSSTSIRMRDYSFSGWKSNSPSSSTLISTTDTVITYTIDVTNSAADSKTVTLKDPLPAEVVFVSANNSGTYDSSTHTVTWGLSVPAGGTRTVEVKVTVKPGTASGTVFENAAEIHYGEGQSQNTNTVSNTYNNGDNLRLSKRNNVSGTVSIGDTIEYTITVDNADSTRASSPHTLVDTLPSGIELTTAQEAALKASYPTAVYNKTAGTITLTVPSIAKSGSYSVKFSADVTKSFDDNTSIVNSVAISDLGLTATNSVRYREEYAQLEVDKEYSGVNKIKKGHWEVDFVISVVNVGDDTGTISKKMSFEDVMSGGLQPIGAGNATSGTIKGTDSKGIVRTGTWVRSASGDEKYPYNYTVTWEILPALATGEVYKISYKGEVFAKIKEDGTFDPFEARNDVLVTGLPWTTGWITVPFYDVLVLQKNITDTNGTVMNTGSFRLYQGDTVTYTIKLQNTAFHVHTGTLTDTLPALSGSAFSWQYGVNVITYAEDGIGTPTYANGVLTWENVEIPAATRGATLEDEIIPGVLEVRVTLKYPSKTVFDKTFLSAVVNTGEYKTYSGEYHLWDEATHRIGDATIEAKKTASKPSVDVTGSTADKTVVFTLKDFGTLRATENVSLLDDMTKLRDFFNISAINFGAFEVYNASGTRVGYTLQLTFSDGSNQSYNIGTNNNTSITYPSGKSVADVVSVRWGFGSVSKLIVSTNPTVTAVARAGLTGVTQNRMYLSYNGKTEFADAEVVVQNSSLVKKTLFDGRGAEVTDISGVNEPKIGATYTYQIAYTNLTNTNIDLSKVTFADSLRVASLDKTKNLVVKVNHVTENGGTGNAATTTGTIAPATWQGGSFNIKLTGTLKPGDTVYIRYEVTTTSELSKSTTVEANKLYNLITITEGGVNYTASSGPFAGGSKNVYIQLQTSVVGQGALHFKGYGAGMYGDSGQANMNYDADWTDVGNDNFTLIAHPAASHLYYSNPHSPINTKSSRYIIYNTTLVNSSASSESIYLDDGALKDIVPSGFSRILPFSVDADGKLKSNGNYYGYSIQTRISGYAEAYFANLGNYPVQDMDGSTTTPIYDGVGLRWSQSGQTWTFGAFGFTAPLEIKPGQSISIYYAVSERSVFRAAASTSVDPDPVQPIGKEIVNTVVLDMSKVKIGTNANSAVVASTNKNKWGLAGYSFDVATLNNDSKPIISDLKSNNGTSSVDADGNIRSEVSLANNQTELSIKKELVAFVDKNGVRHNISDGGSPDKTDKLEWLITVENTGDVNVASYSVVDQIPWPYTIDHDYFGNHATLTSFTNGIEVHRDLGYSTIRGNNYMNKYYDVTGYLSSNLTHLGLPADHVITASNGGESAELFGMSGIMARGALARKISMLPEPNGTGNATSYDALIPMTYFTYGDGAAAAAQPKEGNVPYVTWQLFGLSTESIYYAKTGISGGMTLRPGETVTFRYATEPVTSAAVKVEYRDYENSAYVYLVDDSLTSIGYGEPQYNSTTGALIGAKATAVATVGGAFATDSEKKVTAAKGTVSGDNASNNVVQIGSSETFTYEMSVISRSTATLRNIVVIDRLPTSGDVGAINTSSARGSDFDVSFAASPGVEVWKYTYNGSSYNAGVKLTDYTVGYKTHSATASFSAADWAGTSSWGTAVSGDAIRIVMGSSVTLAQNDKLVVKFKARVTTPSAVTADDIAWNTFGYQYTALDTSNQTQTIKAEPAKVGVKIGGAQIRLVNKVNPEGSPLKGVVFGIYTDSDCKDSSLTGTMTTDASGNATSDILAPKMYYVKEISTLSGYLVSSTIYPVNLSSATVGQVVTMNSSPIVNIREPLTLNVTKAFASGVTPTENVTIKITGIFYGYDTATTRSVVFTPAECNGSTVKPITGILPGNVYVVTEGNDDYIFTASVTSGGSTVTVGSDGKFSIAANGTLAITNNLPQAGKLYVKKAIVGTDGGETFTIQIRGNFSDTSEKTKTISVTPSDRSKTFEITGVKYGEVYTITETNGGANYSVTYSASAVTMGSSNVTVTVTNTQKPVGTLTIKKTIDGLTPTTNQGSFTVKITGVFSDASTSKTVTLSYPSYSATVPNLVIGNTYYVSETDLDAKYASPTYIGTGAGGTVTMTASNSEVIVNNTEKDTVNFSLTKSIEDNTLGTIRTFTFTLEGVFVDGGATETKAGTVTTSTSGLVRWGSATSLELIPGQQYTLTEVAPVGTEGDYQFKQYEITNGTTTSTSTDNPCTFTAETDKSISIVAKNEVKAGTVVVEKKFQDSTGAAVNPDSSKELYIGLFDSEGVQKYVKQIVWGASSGKATFTGVPYGKYTVYELIKDGANYLRASLPATAFEYSVSGEGDIEISAENAASTDPDATIINKERLATANVNVEKLFASTADQEILENETFTVKLIRKDGGVVSGTSTELSLTLTKTTWKASLTNLSLGAGDYVLYEENSGKTWENTALTGQVNGESLTATTASSAGITSIDGDTKCFVFTITSNHLGNDVSIALQVTNKANSKKLTGFEVYKQTDSISGLSSAQKTFEFIIYKGEVKESSKVAVGTLTKLVDDSEQVIVWETPEGDPWSATTQLWDLGETYYVIESNNNMFTLNSVSASTGAATVQLGTAPNKYLAGASFTIVENIDAYSFTFENTRNVVSTMTITKKVVDELDDDVASEKLPSGSTFIFGIYKELSGNKYQIGTVTVVGYTPSYITATEGLMYGETYYIKELRSTPSGRYTFVDFTGSGLTPVPGEEGMYSFVAGTDLAITAKNILEPANLSMTITKNLIDANNAAYTAKEDEKFIFQVTNGTETFHHIVTVAAGTSTATITIKGLPAGTYVVTELSTNWRFSLTTANDVSLELDGDDETIIPGCSFTNKLVNEQWLDDDHSITNKMPMLTVTP